MTITITMELNEQNLDKLKALLPDATMEVKSEQKQITKVKAQKQEQAPVGAVEPQQEEASNDLAPWLPQATVYTNKVETQPQLKKQESAITKEDIRAAALALAQAGKKDKITAIFTKFGAVKLTDFDNKPETYPALMEELKNAATC